MTDFDLQAKCSRDAKTWFNEHGPSADKDTILLHSTNHYNRAQYKCFVLVEYHFSFQLSKETPTWANHVTLWDAYDNLQYGEFLEKHQIVGTGDSLYACEVSGKECKTVDELNNLVRPFMND